METISLETGETATLPPVCRGMTTTENLKSKSFMLDKFDSVCRGMTTLTTENLKIQVIYIR